MPSSSYWISLGILLIPIGAAFKYCFWDFFFNKRETLYNRFSTSIAEVKASLHERRLLPILADITESVIKRKELVPAASTIEILTELSIDARVRDTIEVLSVRFEIDRSYQRVVGLCPKVALSWLIATSSSTVLFFVYHHSPDSFRAFLMMSLLVILVISLLIGGILLFYYGRVRNKFIRILEENRF